MRDFQIGKTAKIKYINKDGKLVFNEWGDCHACQFSHVSPFLRALFGT